MTQPKRVLYRGIPMVEGRHEKIEAAQNILSYTFKGRPVDRIPYGSEKTTGAQRRFLVTTAESSKASFTRIGLSILSCGNGENGPDGRSSCGMSHGVLA